MGNKKMTEPVDYSKNNSKIDKINI